MTNELKEKNQNHRSIFNLLGYQAAGHHGVTYIYLFLLFLSLPYASAQPSPPVDPYGFNTNFNPAMLVILIVLISLFFFMGFFSIYIRQCAENRNGGSLRTNFMGGGLSRRAANRGLDPVVLEAFPTFEYKVVKGLKLGKGALECAVCLNEFEDDETIRLLPKCDHVFHAECIDAWLCNRTTCPVCRADLVPVPGETPATVEVQDLEGESDEEIRGPEIVDVENQEVSIHVTNEEEPAAVGPEVINPVQAPMQNRPTRSRSTRPRNAGRFPRSHSTGHSLVQPGEDVERFTLRLPDEVRKQIMNKKRLKRTTSMVVFPRAGSSRRGYRTTGEGSSRGGRFTRLETGERPEGWVFSMTPPFFMRASSARSPRMTAEGDGTMNPLPPRPFRPSLRGSTKTDGTVPSVTRPQV
ncbi:hypothetical protein NE237_016602 [Protea cynaroides]|uniref:RING-type E3 ubiquitin transferase n=1 Tax=Protea cynaroides TaxID=273540 RepID=A0A9Q0HEE3_9MAGN|nr:hypothetical protein NE237_016602 [Protea cynaroides]